MVIMTLYKTVLTAEIMSDNWKGEEKVARKIRTMTFKGEGTTEREAQDDAAARCSEYCISRYSYRWIKWDGIPIEASIK